ncbi:hypothetical protein ACQEVB_23685 [Pseudonocardia sp. CA-107938]|uniref:hypothetical protein n=1 Tax=Pseudonocardia sp. CA-107938 TaxID=3240021 RepID=UPI003D8D1CB0
MTSPARTATGWTDPWAERPGDEDARLGLAHHGLAVASTGEVLSAHPGRPELLVHDGSGALLRSVPLPVTELHDMTVVEGPDGDHVWVADMGLKVHRRPDGTYPIPTDAGEGKAVLVTLAGEVVRELPTPPGPRTATYRPTSIVVDEVSAGGTGEIWVADGYGASTVHVYGPEGDHRSTLDDVPGAGRFDCPHAMLLDRRTAEPQIYVADRKNRRLVVLDLAGKVKRIVGAEHLNSPSGLTVAGRLLVVAEHRAARLAVFDEDDQLVGFIGEDPTAITRAGWPNAVDADGLPVAPDFASGRFNSPHGLTAGPDGTVYVAEYVIGGRVVRLASDLFARPC